jgi:putative oxidoreductase
MNNYQHNSHGGKAVDAALLIVRIVLGTIFIAHGSQKLFGAFGGSGLAGIVEMLGPAGYLVALGEFFGGVGILIGFLSRFCAAGIVVIMIGALALVHGQNGLFLSNNGFEYVLALIALALVVVLMGPGCYAFGRYLGLAKAKRILE